MWSAGNRCTDDMTYEGAALGRMFRGPAHISQWRLLLIPCQTLALWQLRIASWK